MLSFNELQLNYILEAVQHFREVTLNVVECPEVRTMYIAELDGIIEKILVGLDGDEE